MDWSGRKRQKEIDGQKMNDILNKKHMNTLNNPYLIMPIDRVRQDAANGVSLARQAYAKREPQEAWKLGIGIEPGQKRVIAAVGDYCRTKKSRSRKPKSNVRN